MIQCPNTDYEVSVYGIELRRVVASARGRVNRGIDGTVRKKFLDKVF
jgi:hypothetical protein